MAHRDRLVAAIRDVRRQPREYAKLAVRSVLYPRGLDLVAAPYPVQICRTLRWLDADTVLDVGANIGQFGSALRYSGYEARIVSCEPLSAAYSHLARRAARDPNWTVHNVAVGSRQGTLEINVAANSFSSSILPMTSAHSDAAPGSEFVGRETVQVVTVADLVRADEIVPAGTLLKIDTQGYETAVLDGAASLIGKFAAIALELSFVPLYEGQELFDDLVIRLRDAGYVLHALDAGFGDPRTGRTLQCDGLFVRDDRPPGG